MCLILYLCSLTSRTTSTYSGDAEQAPVEGKNSFTCAICLACSWFYFTLACWQDCCYDESKDMHLLQDNLFSVYLQDNKCTCDVHVCSSSSLLGNIFYNLVSTLKLVPVMLCLLMHEGSSRTVVSSTYIL